MADGKFSRRGGGDVSPYLERPLRTLAQAERDRQLSRFFGATASPVLRGFWDSPEPTALSPKQHEYSLSTGVGLARSKK